MSTPVAPPRTLGELFLGFFSIGARAFGGVLPWAHRVLVEERRWVTPADLAELIALGQFLPGPNVANVSIVLGRRWFGIAGALTAFAGLMGPPFVWVLCLALLYGEYADQPLVRALIAGVGAAGAGLFIGTAWKLGRALLRRPAAIVLIVLAFAAVGVARLSLMITLPVLLVLCLVLSQRRWL